MTEVNSQDNPKEAPIHRLYDKVAKKDTKVARKIIEYSKVDPEEQKRVHAFSQNLERATNTIREFDALSSEFLLRMKAADYPYAHKLIGRGFPRIGIRRYLPDRIQAPKLAKRARIGKTRYATTYGWEALGYKLWEIDATEEQTFADMSGVPSHSANYISFDVKHNFWLLIGGEIVKTRDSEDTFYWYEAESNTFAWKLSNDKDFGGYRGQPNGARSEKLLQDAVESMANYLAAAGINK